MYVYIQRKKFNKYREAQRTLKSLSKCLLHLGVVATFVPGVMLSVVGQASVPRMVLEALSVCVPPVKKSCSEGQVTGTACICSWRDLMFMSSAGHRDHLYPSKVGAVSCPWWLTLDL